MNNLNSARRLQVWPFGIWEIYTAEILPELFLKYTGVVLFKLLLSGVIMLTWHNYAFSGKNTGDLMADQDLMVLVTLFCPL